MKKEKDPIILVDPNKAQGGEKQESIAVGRVHHAHINYSYEKNVENRVKPKWYYYVPGVIFILIIVIYGIWSLFQP